MSIGRDMHGLIEVREFALDTESWKVFEELDFIGKMSRDYDVQSQIIYGKFTVRESELSPEALKLYKSWEPAGHDPSIIPFKDLETLRLPYSYYEGLVLKSRRLLDRYMDVRIVVWFDN